MGKWILAGQLTLWATAPIFHHIHPIYSHLVMSYLLTVFSLLWVSGDEGTRLSCAPLNSQGPQESSTYNWCLINICWMNKCETDSWRRGDGLETGEGGFRERVSEWLLFLFAPRNRWWLHLLRTGAGRRTVQGWGTLTFRCQRVLQTGSWLNRCETQRRSLARDAPLGLIQE